jgi:hypothetical protein
LERAQRTAIDPLSPLYDLYVGVCAMYLASFLHLNLFEHGTDLNLYAACLVIFVAITGILVPVLTGSILTLARN